MGTGGIAIYSNTWIQVTICCHYDQGNQAIFGHIAIYGIASIFDRGDGGHTRARHACKISQLGSKIFRLSRDRATFSAHSPQIALHTQEFW